jgi:ubiquinone/menaquinone biosynthesis C-methylase UbiE
MRVIQAVIRYLFRLLYHQFAFAYDIVASIVSLGHWKDWVKSIIPLIQPGAVLELGFGPGHLQLALLESGINCFGLDESRQMNRLASRRLKTHGFTNSKLARGLASNLPYPSERFETILSTFPSEYIFGKLTQEEIHRVLTENGRLIILPAVWYRGGRFLEKVMAWLFEVTGETPGVLDLIKDQYKVRMESSRFNVETHLRELGSISLLILIATKQSKP